MHQFIYLLLFLYFSLFLYHNFLMFKFTIPHLSLSPIHFRLQPKNQQVFSGECTLAGCAYPSRRTGQLYSNTEFGLWCCV